MWRGQGLGTENIGSGTARSRVRHKRLLCDDRSLGWSGTLEENRDSKAVSECAGVLGTDCALAETSIQVSSPYLTCLRYRTREICRDFAVKGREGLKIPSMGVIVVFGTYCYTHLLSWFNSWCLMSIFRDCTICCTVI